MRKLLTGIALAALVFCTSARADMTEKTGAFAGLKVPYKVVLPDGYDPARAYPMVLVFTGGAQTIQAAGSTLEADWRKEGERRGYILISPGTPNGELFFEGADKIFPAFLDMLLRDYKVAGKIHIAGHSNGGLSAYHIASLYPKYFSTVTGYPGLLDGDVRAMSALKPLCLYMHAGDMDDGWRPAMEAEAKGLREAGYKIAITIEKNQTHRLKAQELNLSPRLFDEIESCK